MILHRVDEFSKEKKIRVAKILGNNYPFRPCRIKTSNYAKLMNNNKSKEYDMKHAAKLVK